MTALQIDALFTAAACLGEIAACLGAALLLGIPQRAGRGLVVAVAELRRAYWLSRWRVRRSLIRARGVR